VSRGYKWDAVIRGISALRSQRLFFESDSQYTGLSGPVGSGKSMALALRVLKAALANPGLPGVVAAPTYGMLSDVTKSAILEVLEMLGGKWKPAGADTIQIISLGNARCDSIVRFRSMDRPERLIGANLAWFAVDELTYCKEDSWRRLEARLRHPRARWRTAFAVWTPKGFDWVYKRFIDAARRKAGHVAILAKPYENRRILDADPSYYERLKESYDERFYQQEVLGLYLNVNTGAAYHAWDRAKNHLPGYCTPGAPVYWALDFNVDPMASVIAQIDEASHPGGSILRVVDNIFLRNADTTKACAAFVEKTRHLARPGFPVHVKVYGDASGNSRKTSGQSDYQIIREYFGSPHLAHSYRVEILVGGSNPPVRDRVNTLNGLLCNSIGERRLLVDTDKCQALVQDLEETNWASNRAGGLTGELDQTTDPMRTHITDALGYLAWAKFGLRSRGGFAQGVAQ
jgi:hypothetical protein